MHNYSGGEVDVQYNDNQVEIIIGRARKEVASDYAQSMAAGHGPYARALEGSYHAKRKAT